MPRRKMWFGTRGQEVWVDAPAISPDYARSGFATRADLVNGGASVRQSKNAHNSYTLSYGPAKKRDSVRMVTDFADGVFDTQPGVNLIYWIDPMARDKNVLPQAWATPALATEDAPALITDSNGYGRPKAVPTPLGGYRYPARSAQYTITPTSLRQEIYLPIPPGFSVFLGIHGDSAAQDALEVQPVNGFTAVGAVVKPTVLGVAAPTLVNTEFASTASSGIVLRVAASGTTKVFTLHGLIAQVLPTGVTPGTGAFISGQGHSGCQFVGNPSLTPYSAKLDMVGASWRLEETGMYL